MLEGSMAKFTQESFTATMFYAKPVQRRGTKIFHKGFNRIWFTARRFGVG